MILNPSNIPTNFPLAYYDGLVEVHKTTDETRVDRAIT
jgi:hypothetical protein